MTESEIVDLSGQFYAQLRSRGLAPPDKLVIESITSPLATERIVDSGTDFVDVVMKRAQMGGQPILVVTLFRGGSTREVWMSLAMPLYLERPTPVETLEFFAVRFGVMFVVNGNVTKFARGVEVPMSQASREAVFQPLEDGNCSFILFSPVMPGENIARIPICFGIDLDHYAQWRQRVLPSALEDTHIVISDRFRSIIDVTMLLDARAMFQLRCAVQGGKLDDEIIFDVVSPDYSVSTRIENGKFILRRNSKEISIKIPPLDKETDELAMRWGWLPQLLTVVAVPKSDTSQVREAVLSTELTFPPRKLLGWARQERMRPEFLYETDSHLFRTVIDLLLGVQDKIVYTGLQTAFWNRFEDKTRLPKRETDVHRIVEALIFDSCIAKNLQCFAEPRLEGGNIDFLITGTLTTGTHLPVCVEFKNAHAGDLAHGIDTQLPAYMASKASDAGIYCVLYYRCDEFEQPKQAANDLRRELEARSQVAGTNIKVLVLELGFIKPPSKR